MSLNNLNATDPVDLDGVYFVGVVIDNDDPDCMERIKCTVDNLYQGAAADLPWCAPAHGRMFGNSGNAGTFSVPAVGTKVWIVCQQGDSHHPIYLGGFLASDGVVGEGRTSYPKRYGFKDPQGNIFYIDYDTGDVRFEHNSGTTITIDPAGKVEITGVDDINVTAAGIVNVVGTMINLN